MCSNVKLNAQCIADAGPNQNFCCGSVITLSASMSQTFCSCTNYSYVWSPTVGLSNPYIANPTATLSGSITYSVCITAYKNHGCFTFCCSACDYVSYNVTTFCCRLMDVNEANTNAADIKIFPNPGTSKITLQINTQLENAAINIYDINGKIIWQKNEINGTNIIDVNVADLPRGVYFINAVEGDREVYKNKILLE